MSSLPKKLILILTMLVVATLFFVACKKDSNPDVAQNYVDISLYINEPSNIALNAVGGWKYIVGGTKGIIVYRKGGGGQNEFTALERNCTYDPTAACSIVEVVSGISSVDSCCNSRFSIYDGSVINGPATQALYQYNTFYDAGNGILRIYNW